LNNHFCAHTSFSFSRKITILLNCILLTIIPIRAGFPSGTLIKVKDGFIPVEKLQKNNTILSPEYSYFFGEKPITSIQKRTVDDVLHIIINKDNSFFCCKDAQFYIPKEKQWRKAEYLNIGDNLLQESTGRLKIKDIKHINKATDIFDIALGTDTIFCVSKNAFLVNCKLQLPSLWNSFCSWISDEGSILSGSLSGIANFALKKMTGGNQGSHSINKESMDAHEKNHDDLVDELESRYENKIYNTNISTHNTHVSNSLQKSQALITCGDTKLSQKSIVTLNNFKPKQQSNFRRFSCNDSMLQMNPCMGGAVTSVFTEVSVDLPFGGPTVDEVSDMLQSFRSFKNNRDVDETPTFVG
jgi:hypothetical protein